MTAALVGQHVPLYNRNVKTARNRIFASTFILVVSLLLSGCGGSFNNGSDGNLKEIQKVINQALENIVQFRKDEGASLEKEFQLRIAKIRTLMKEAVAYDAERVATVKTRLRTALEELKVAVDENRFEQELIFYLEKYDITEEKVRLDNHLNYFIETLSGNEANGRKLGFITQEMGREINTMGSKSNHAEMQKLVVMMKDELEKIKEQVLNVL